MPHVPLDGPQFRPPVQQVRPATGPRLPLLPAVLVMLYLIYIGALIIAPYFIEPYGRLLDRAFPPMFRVVLAVVLMIVFGGLMLFELLKGQKDGRPAHDLAPANRAAPLGGGYPQGIGQPRFTPVPPPGIPSPATPRTPPGAREVERPTSAPKIFTYPQDVEGGIYGDTYIQLSPSKIVRLRSLMVDQRYMS